MLCSSTADSQSPKTTLIWNEMSFDVNVFVKIDGKPLTGAGVQHQGVRKTKVSKLGGFLEYDLKNRIPKEEIMFVVEIDSSKMASYKRFGAKIALGEKRDIIGSKLIFDIPHHFEFNKSTRKLGAYELIIHYTDIRQTIISQAVPKLREETFDEFCEGEEGGFSCTMMNGNKINFESFAEKEFIDFVISKNTKRIEEAIITYYEDEDPTVKHPGGS
jgi:hypothetical protein